jgi:hypothetical protein
MIARTHDVGANDATGTPPEAPRGRRSWDSLLPLLVGLAIGLLSGFGVVNGRLTTVETKTANLEHVVEAQQKTIDGLRGMEVTLAKIEAMVEQSFSLRRAGKTEP